MINFYIVMFIIAIINLVILLFKQTHKNNIYMGAIFIIVAISNWGYLEMALADTIGEAILAQKIAYIAAAYCSATIFLLILQTCKYKLLSVIEFLIYLIPFVVLIAVATIGYSDLYYKNVEIHKINGITILDKEYGVWHTVYYFILAGYILASIATVVYTLMKKRQVSFKNMLLFALIEVISISSFLLGKFVGDTVEIMPIIYILDEWVLLYICRRLTMYDVEYNILSSLEKQNTSGYIVVSNRKKYLGSNDVARVLFSELDSLRIDFPVSRHKMSIFNTFFDWIDELKANKELECITKEYEKDNKYYLVNIKYIYHHGKRRGNIIEVIDDTNRQNYINLLNSYNSELVKEVEEKTSHIKAVHNKILYTMSDMIENRDNNTGGHINRTSTVVKILLDKMNQDNMEGVSSEFCKAVIKAAPMHDMGKITIDDAILRKPGKLTDEEYDIMKTHSSIGAKMVEKILEDVEDVNFIKIAVNIARHHHEKWNGAGYPDKLAGEDIPLEARIMAVADVYDALVSKRCYKEKMSYEMANKVILESMGSHFDPMMQKYFEMARPELEEYYETQQA